MKNQIKLLMIVVVLTMTSQSFAQTKKGNLVLSGGTGLQFSSSNVKYYSDGLKYDEDKLNTLSVTPSFAYFIADDFALGLNTSIESSTYKYGNGDKDLSNTTTILPTLTYYFPVAGQIRPLVQVGAGLYSSTSKFVPKTGSDEKSSASGLALNVGGGIACFIRENISLNFGLSFTRINATDGDDNLSKTEEGIFGSNIGLSIYF